MPKQRLSEGALVASITLLKREGKGFRFPNPRDAIWYKRLINKYNGYDVPRPAGGKNGSAYSGLQISLGSQNSI